MNEPRASIVSVITTPLGFFALALLIVEGFLSIVMIFSDIDAEEKFLGMCIGAGLFALVVLMVFALAIFWPERLTFNAQTHFDWMKLNKTWGTSDTPTTRAGLDEPTQPTLQK